MYCLYFIIYLVLYIKNAKKKRFIFFIIQGKEIRFDLVSLWNFRTFNHRYF